VLLGETDFAVMDLIDASDGVAQGLPIVALAGHRNYEADGAYGGDVLVSSSDLLDGEASTVSAFLVAYLRGLRDLATSADTDGFAPYDGGFGTRDEDGGLGEMRTHITDALGAEPDLQSLIAIRPLEYAQAWWGLPANPVVLPTVPLAATAGPNEEGE